MNKANFVDVLSLKKLPYLKLPIFKDCLPIYDQKSKVVAALNIVSPTMRTTKEYLIQHILPLLQETARELRNIL